MGAAPTKIPAEKYGPWCVIAGGSEGMGACFARRLAATGINLVLLARNPGPLAETAGEIRAAHGVEVRTLGVDLAADDMLPRIRAVTDGLEVGSLIYNAGGAGGAHPFVEAPLERGLANLRLNVAGQTALAHHFGRAMCARGRGGILLVGSLGCIAGTKDLAVYSAAKSYTLTFGEALWSEFRPRGVDVLVMVIGRTLTPALERAGLGSTDEAPAADPDQMAALGLENWGNGPVVIPPEHVKAFEAMRAMPRRKAVEIMIASMEAQTRR
jgi:short-subunit dehydrogenase